MNWPHLHILVTRPQERAQDLIKALYAHQASVLLFPTLTIQPINHPYELEQQVERIQEFDWLFFISPNAVEHAMPAILKHHAMADLPCQWGAVGAGTNDMLKHYGVYDVVYPEDGVGAQALLDKLKTVDLKSKTCAVFKGNSGNDQLEAGLRERGAQVTEFMCYQRIRTENNPRPLAHAINEGSVDLIIITSGEALSALYALLAPAIVQMLLAIPVLVISPRIENIAHTLGFRRILLAKDASDEAIIACIDAWLQTRTSHDT